MFAQFLKMRKFDSSFQPVVVEVKIIDVACRFEFQLVKKGSILHDISSIENIKLVFFSDDTRIFH